MGPAGTELSPPSAGQRVIFLQKVWPASKRRIGEDAIGGGVSRAFVISRLVRKVAVYSASLAGSRAASVTLVRPSPLERGGAAVLTDGTRLSR